MSIHAWHSWQSLHSVRKRHVGATPSNLMQCQELVSAPRWRGVTWGMSCTFPMS